MKTLLLFSLTIFLTMTQSKAEVSATDFCPDTAYCTEISAGYAYLGDGNECLIANGPRSLGNLFKLVGTKDLTGMSDTSEIAMNILNANRKSQGLSEVGVSDLVRNEVLFVSISEKKNERYSLSVFFENPNKIILRLVVGSTPEISGNIDRTPQVQKNAIPFYRVIALSGSILDQYKISSWTDAEIHLHSSDGTPDGSVEEFDCKYPPVN